MIAAAMNTRPQEVLPYRDLARRQARISRQIGLEDLPRIMPLAAGPAAPLDVVLGFSHDPEGFVRVVGQIAGRLPLVCSGCAETVEHDFRTTFDLLIVATEETASERGADEDVLVADGSEINLLDLVEDEILLGLPERLCVTEPCTNAPALH
ncbi:MAG: YceD family protein, partial [Gammaproteobacteria bacterium]